jgi:hypothetical protein
MWPLVYSVAIFALSVLASLGGMKLARQLPPEYLSEESKHIIHTMIAVVGTLTALVLGLLVASAQSSLDEKVEHLRHIAALTILLDRTMAEYGPETADARALLKTLLEKRLNQIWQGRDSSAEEVQKKVTEDGGIELVQRLLLRLEPHDAAQTWTKQTALDVTKDIATARWEALQSAAGSVQLPFVGVLAFWIVVLFGTFGVFAPRNNLVVATLLISTLSVSCAVFLILEMDQPFAGLIRISSKPLITALEQLGRP